MKEITTILFDLDGTLIDSVPDLALSVNQMLAKMDQPPFEVDAVRNWIGNGAEMLVRRALSGSREPKAIDDEVFTQAYSLFMQAYSDNLCVNTITFEGVKETLQTLYTQGYQMAIVTNKPYAFVPPLLEALQIENFFRVVLGGDSVTHKKPAPDMLIEAMRQLNVEASACIMVGDSKNDIVAAKNATIPSIAVNYGYNYEEKVSDYNPEYVIEHFSEIVALVGAYDG